MACIALSSLIGFAGALRRSELVALNVEDIRFTADGTIVHLRRSKTDQEGQGRDVVIPLVRGRFCPSRTLLAWLQVSGITTGAIFRRIDHGDRVLPQRLSCRSSDLI